MMVLEQPDIFVRHLLAIHLLHPVGKDTTVETDEVLLRELSYESCKILLLNVGVCIILASCSCILSLTILDKEIKMVANFSVFSMLLPVKHVSLGNSKVLFSHEADLNLVLNLLHMHSFSNAHMGKNVDKVFFSCKSSY